MLRASSRWVRKASTSPAASSVDPYTAKVSKSKFDCIDQLKKVDPSTLLISKFYPGYIQDSLIGLKSFNLELSKISFGHQVGSSEKAKQFNNLKFEFWQNQLDKLNKLHLENASEIMPLINEPSAVLIADSILKDLNFDKSMLSQLVSSHSHFYNNNSTSGFRTLDDICSFGEGTNSQINYMMQSILLSENLSGFSTEGINLLKDSSNDLRNSLSEISGHLGQATSICSFLIGIKYFAEKKNTLMIPTDLLIANDLPEEEAIRLILGTETDEKSKEKLKNVIFEMATKANDHILTARSKLSNLKEVWGRRTLPDCIYLPIMNGIPSILFLEKLEGVDFDILHPKLQSKEWRLPFRAWWGHLKSNL